MLNRGYAAAFSGPGYPHGRRKRRSHPARITPRPVPTGIPDWAA